MPYFIATVWTVSMEDGVGWEYTRQVRRHEAASVQGFKLEIMQELELNDEIVIGPVGLSKDQTTYERDYPNTAIVSQ